MNQPANCPSCGQLSISINNPVACYTCEVCGYDSLIGSKPFGLMPMLLLFGIGVVLAAIYIGVAVTVLRHF